MKLAITHKFKWGSAAIAVAFSCSATAETNLATVDERVHHAARAVMAQYGIPGMAIGITSGGRQHFVEYGVASQSTQQRVTADTLFEIGSVSKTLTATLAAYAEALGKLSLTDSPVRYLPELNGSQLEQVTLINLATHTAGGFPLQLPEEIKTEQQLTGYFRAWQPSYARGPYRTYANPSMGLLGRATATALDQSYTEALQAELLPKLGMRSTYTTVPQDEMKRYAQGYNKDGQPVRLNPALLADEAYGVKTSSRDLLRFVEAQLGVIEVDADVQAAMRSTRVGYYRIGAMTQALVWEQYAMPASLDDLLAGNASKMALEPAPAQVISPPLAPQQAVWVNKTGSTNGFGAYVAFIPAERLGIVILANRFYPNEARVKLAYRILTALGET